MTLPIKAHSAGCFRGFDQNTCDDSEDGDCENGPEGDSSHRLRFGRVLF